MREVAEDLAGKAGVVGLAGVDAEALGLLWQVLALMASCGGTIFGGRVQLGCGPLGGTLS